MRDARIRNARDNISFRIAAHHISSCELRAAVVARLLDVAAFICRRRKTVIYPQECADLHLFIRWCDHFDPVRRDKIDLARAELAVRHISKVQIREIFKTNAVSKRIPGRGITCFDCCRVTRVCIAVLLISIFVKTRYVVGRVVQTVADFAAYFDRRPAVAVTCGVDSVFRHNKECQRTFDDFLCISDAFNERVFLIYDSRDKLGRIDVSAAHLQEMRVAVCKNQFCDFVNIVDPAYRRNSICSKVRANHQRLRLIIGDAADSNVSAHFQNVFIELGSEICCLYVVDRAVEAFLNIICHQSRAPGSEM